MKAYEPGTTTPKPIAIGPGAPTLVAKLQLNADGFIVSAGGAIVMPYIDGAYDMWLFPTEAEADANDTSNAQRVADNLNPSSDETGNQFVSVDETQTLTAGQTTVNLAFVDALTGVFYIADAGVDRGRLVVDIDYTVTSSGLVNVIELINSFPNGAVLTASSVALVSSDLVNNLSQAYEFPTVAAYKAFTLAFPVGKVINLLDRDAGFTVIAGTATGNGSSIVVSDTVDQSIELKETNTYYASKRGLTGVDDTVLLQDMITKAATAVSLGQEITLIFDGEPRFIDTLTVPVNSNRIPSIKTTGLLTYAGPNDRAAFVVGQSGAAVIVPSEIDLAIVNENQSDWSNDDCSGISLINLNSFDLIRIRRAQGFTNGLLVKGDLSGFSYNNITLGYMINNKRGVFIRPSTGGWCNENTFIGGRFGVFDGVNSTLIRFGVVLDGIVNPPSTFVNNIVFLKPSFELNETDAPGLSVGAFFRYASNNHIIDCRSEKTGVVAQYDTEAIRNLVEVGFNDVNSIGVVDNSQSPDNITTSANTRHENHSHQVFSADDLLPISTIAGAGLLDFPNKLAIAQGSTGSIVTFMAGTQGTDFVTLTDADKAIGAKINTESVKTFNVSYGLFGANGVRGFVVCYDAVGTPITTGTPVKGTANNTFSLSGFGYQTGADTLSTVSMKFSDDVKSAFIGIRKGSTGDININSIAVNAMDSPDGINRPALYSIG